MSLLRIQKNQLSIILYLFVFLLTCRHIDGNPTLFGGFCKISSWLRINSWGSWSSCTARCGGGVQTRARSGDTTCTDKRECNTQCFNGGIFQHDALIPLNGASHCHCKTGTFGSCCEQVVTCGSPSKISHGIPVGSVFTYNNQITYRCDENYNMTDSSESVHTCSQKGTWVGSLPKCEYAVSCKSGPCKNEGICTNHLGDYSCFCLSGWKGKNCEIDVQPPLLQNCPSNRTLLVSTLTTNQTWTEPNFTDPHGLDIDVTSNYPTSSYEFPWGEFGVQYDAVKPSNGMKSECTFDISVKPHPCSSLQAPMNGALACNAWKQDYAQVCKYYCSDGFSLPPGFQSDHFIACGASGDWSPRHLLTDCIQSNLLSVSEANKATPKFESCVTEKKTIAAAYVNDLKRSQFNSLCIENISVCNMENVSVHCGMLG